jgi:hypothetical protein
MKTKLIRNITIALLFILALGSLASADTLPTLTLIPASGDITGAAGSITGWGFTIDNLGSNWLVITSTDFCVGVVTSPCSNSFGTYTDFAGPQFILIGPSPENTSFTQAFDNNTQQGIGSFFINPSSLGTISGQIALTYDLFSVDPNSIYFDPFADTVSAGNYLFADASVTVTTSTVATPEPRTLLLVFAGIALLFAARRFLA